METGAALRKRAQSLSSEAQEVNPRTRSLSFSLTDGPGSAGIGL